MILNLESGRLQIEKILGQSDRGNNNNKSIEIIRKKDVREFSDSTIHARSKMQQQSTEWPLSGRPRDYDLWSACLFFKVG
jgi:hypothetical protein